jgi:hypothetical protein
MIKKSNSTSHLSYDLRIGNLICLRKFYANATAYTPNEDEIKIKRLDALKE